MDLKTRNPRGGNGVNQDIQKEKSPDHLVGAFFLNTDFNYWLTVTASPWLQFFTCATRLSE